MTPEIWKPVEGFETRYEVSDLGRVRSLDRHVRTVARSGRATTRFVKGRVLKPQPHSAGYSHVHLSGTTYTVHRIVLAAFVGPCPAGMEGAHKNGVKKDNTLTNLKYATFLENADDRRKHGTSGKGEANAMSKLTQKQVKEIRKSNLKQRDLAARYGVQQSAISKIVTGKSWL